MRSPAAIVSISDSAPTTSISFSNGYEWALFACRVLSVSSSSCSATRDSPPVPNHELWLAVCIIPRSVPEWSKTIQLPCDNHSPLSRERESFSSMRCRVSKITISSLCRSSFDFFYLPPTIQKRRNAAMARQNEETAYRAAHTLTHNCSLGK